MHSQKHSTDLAIDKDQPFIKQGSSHDHGNDKDFDETTHQHKESERNMREEAVHEMPFLVNNGGELFDRQSEQNRLFKAFRRCCHPNKAPIKKEFVIISGQSGTGKTYLAETLKEQVTKKSGYFLRGKFDQNQRPQPFAPLVSAFTEYVNFILRKDSNHIKTIKAKIQQEVALELRLLLDMIPAFEGLIGPYAYSSNYSKGVPGLQKNLNIMLRNLVRAICSPRCPIAILIDDLQWADQGTLLLLEALITDQFSQGFIIVGTCRDDEVKKGHEVAKMLCRIEDNNSAHICNIELVNISQNAVNRWLSSSLMLPLENTLPMANFIYKKTNGNFHFLAEIIRFLYEEGILYIYPGTTSWTWDDDEIKCVVTKVDNIDVLESTKMKQLPTKVKYVIRMAACIGAEFEQHILTSLVPEDQVQYALDLLEDQGFIVPDTSRKGLYRFTHDRIQQGAYSLIPKENQIIYNLWLGRTLYEKLPEEQINKHIFLILDQLLKGKSLIKNQEEKDQVALLCLRAAEKAIKSSDFVTASVYLDHGVGCLGGRYWRDQYHLSWNIFNTAAEVECCLANLSRMEMLIDEIILNARSLPDQMRAFSTRVHSLAVRHKMEEALDLGFQVLERLGEPFPKKVRMLNVLAEMQRTKRSLKDLSEKDILELPTMSDQTKLCAMQMMSMVVTSCFLTKQHMLPLISCRMIRLTLDHGLSAESSMSFVSYGLVLCGNHFYQYGEAFKYSRLGISIAEKFGMLHLTAKVASIFYGFVSSWKSPMRVCLLPLKETMQIGFNTGNVEGAAICTLRYAFFNFFSGSMELGSLEKEMRYLMRVLVSYKQEHLLGMFKCTFQVVLNLLGRSENPEVLAGESYNVDTDIEHESNTPIIVAYIWFNCAMIAYLFNEYELAAQMAGKEPMSPSSSLIRDQLFYEGLIFLALAQNGINVYKNLHKARVCLKKLKKLGKHCPESSTGKILLLEGEISVLKGDVHRALEKFQASIGLSICEKSQHEQALGYERAYFACKKIGDIDRARDFATRARTAYGTWGATAKVDQLEGVIDSLA